MTWFNVKFIFDNDQSQHLEYFVEASDIIQAEEKAFLKLGDNGKKHKTSAEITPIVLNLTLGKAEKKYDSFKDQFSDDPHIAELSIRYLRGTKQIKEEIEKMLKKMFSPLPKEYQNQAITTLKMMVGLAACLDYAKYGDKPYLMEWLKEKKN